MSYLFSASHTCDPSHIRKNGKTSSGGQRFRCDNCGKSTTVGSGRQGYNDTFRQYVVDRTQDDSIRDVAKKYGVSPTTVVNRKKELGPTPKEEAVLDNPLHI